MVTAYNTSSQSHGDDYYSQMGATASTGGVAGSLKDVE